MERKARKITINSISVLLGLFSFTVGGLIYLSYRSRSLRMFEWADKLSVNGLVDKLRSYSEVHPCNSKFVLFSLPDGLWVLSYVFIMSALWGYKLKEYFFIISFIPLIAVLSELLQLIHVLPGVFDYRDLIAYFGAFILGILYTLNIQKIYR